MRDLHIYILLIGEIQSVAMYQLPGDLRAMYVLSICERFKPLNCAMIDILY